MPEEKSDEISSASAVYKDLEAIKKKHPTIDEWIVHELNGEKFVFCQYVHPSYGVSLIEFRGWFFDSRQNVWKHFITASTRGVGNAEIVFDDDKGLCALRGKANNRFKNMDVVLINLYLTEL